MSQREVAFFDLDKTLLEVNSGSVWLRSEWQAGEVGLDTLLRGAWYLFRYALGHNQLDSALADAAAIYAGVPEHDVRTRVEIWFNEHIRHRVRPGALAALAEHRAAGHTLVLATTSSQFIAASALRAFDLDDAVSTVVEVREGKLTGRIAQSALGAHKSLRCEAWCQQHGASLERATFYTDSYTDLPLLERVAHPVVVHPDRKLRAAARARGWKVVDWSSGRQG